MQNSHEEMITVRFIPQLWIGPNKCFHVAEHHSIAGFPDTWQVPKSRIANIEPRSLEADELAFEPEAPQWVHEWALGNPFEIDWNNEQLYDNQSGEELS